MERVRTDLDQNNLVAAIGQLMTAFPIVDKLVIVVGEQTIVFGSPDEDSKAAITPAEVSEASNDAFPGQYL